MDLSQNQHGRSFTPDRTSSRYIDKMNRHSLPTSSAVPGRRSSKHMNVPPESSEVISSLISTLSAISTPTQSQFDGPISAQSASTAPSSPTFPVRGRDTSGVTPGGFGVDYGAFNQSERQQEGDRLHPDDAAIPPVVRTAPRPRPASGMFNSQNRQSLTLSLRSGAEGSHLQVPGDEPGSPHSIGNVSIEPGHRKSTTSLRSVSSSKSLRSPKGLEFKSSKEKIREIDRERKRKTAKGEEGSKSSKHSPKIGTAATGSSRSTVRASNNKGKNPMSPQGATLPIPSPNATAGPSNAVPVEDGPESPSIGLPIPLRDSSLRHSMDSTTARRKRRSHRSDQIQVDEEVDEKAPEALGETIPPQSTQPAGNVLDAPEDDEVTRRIRELKAQKELRERLREAEAKATPEPTKEPTHHRVPSGRSSLPASLHVRKGSAGPSGSISRSRTEPQIKEDTQRKSDVRVPMQPLTVNGTQRSISADGRMDKPQDGKYRAFEAQYNAQKSATGLFGTASAPILQEKNTQTFFNGPAQAGKGAPGDPRPSTADSIDDEVEAYISQSRLSQKISHPTTGRVISFSDVGDPNGYVVFCCVGMGLTRYLTAFYDDLAVTLKLRLITIDRPGVGESEAYSDGTDTPLGWPDDVRAVCQHLNISRFSLLAHSAGAIYALATALRMPQHIRGRIHLLAPWIPPSQLSAIGTTQDPLPVTAIPYSQRLLRSLPTPFLKAANSNFFSATSTSITTSLPRSPRRVKRRSLTQDTITGMADGDLPAARRSRSRRSRSASRQLQRNGETIPNSLNADAPNIVPDSLRASHVSLPNTAHSKYDKERQIEYDTRLTHAIWDLSTANANPAVDLLVCLERRQDIGFRYVDIAKPVVIHHGSKDSRVPVENVRWLGKMMRRCEVRILPGEGHGLMASATVMGAVLTEMSKDWEDWNLVVKGKRAEKGKAVAT